MNSTISTLVSPLRRTLTRRESIALVFCCTFIGAAAQILMKIGAHNLPAGGPAAIAADPLILLTNFALLGGLEAFGPVGLLAGPLILAFFLAVVRITQREYPQPG